MNDDPVFLGLNGFDVIDDEGCLYDAMTGLAAGEWGKGQMAALRRPSKWQTRPVSPK